MGSDYYQAKADGLAALAGFPGTIGLDVDEGSLAGIDQRLAAVQSWLATSQLADAADRVTEWWQGRIAEIAALR